MLLQYKNIFFFILLIFILIIPANLATASPIDLSKILPSVVKINEYQKINNRYVLVAGATGFSVKYNKKFDITYILTNNHVCGEDIITYKSSDDEIMDDSFDYHKIAAILKTSKDNDLCLLAIFGYIPPVEFTNTTKLKQASEIYLIGNPEGIFPTIQQGFYSGKISRDFFYDKVSPVGDNLIMISASIKSGESGSPIITRNNKVIGIISMGRLEGLNAFGIPSEDIIEFLRDVE